VAQLDQWEKIWRESKLRDQFDLFFYAHAKDKKKVIERHSFHCGSQPLNDKQNAEKAKIAKELEEAEKWRRQNIMRSVDYILCSGLGDSMTRTQPCDTSLSRASATLCIATRRVEQTKPHKDHCY
jgi:hypothetical protein